MSPKIPKQQKQPSTDRPPTPTNPSNPTLTQIQTLLTTQFTLLESSISKQHDTFGQAINASMTKVAALRKSQILKDVNERNERIMRLVRENVGVMVDVTRVVLEGEIGAILEEGEER